MRFGTFWDEKSDYKLRDFRKISWFQIVKFKFWTSKIFFKRLSYSRSASTWQRLWMLVWSLNQNWILSVRKNVILRWNVIKSKSLKKGGKKIPLVLVLALLFPFVSSTGVGAPFGFISSVTFASTCLKAVNTAQSCLFEITSGYWPPARYSEQRK